MPNQIKRHKEKAMIPTIKDAAEKPTNSPQEINKIFRDFYAKAYSSDNDTGQDAIDSFFSYTELPQLSKEHIYKLDSLLIEV